jgi:hypothetical protein
MNKQTDTGFISFPSLPANQQDLYRRIPDFFAGNTGTLYGCRVVA